MKYIEVTANAGSADTIRAIAEKVKALDFRLGVVGDDGLQLMRILIADDSLQKTLDTLQNILGAQPSARIVVLPIEIHLPKQIEKERAEKGSLSTAREALYQEVEKGARLEANFLILVILSTIVAAIGLVEDNVAVVIGAMVIAPLLGPNLALSLGTALGDMHLIKKSIKTLSFGVSLAVIMSVFIGLFWPGNLNSHELMTRTTANLDSVALALASGAAATLSLTTGLSGVLVGVMVAVALLPPAVTLGIMLGAGNIQLAVGAGVLLAINIVSVNLSSKLVFLLKGVGPRTWVEKEAAKIAMTRYIIGWVVSLLVLVAFIFIQGRN